jgi:predicted phage tail protein
MDEERIAESINKLSESMEHIAEEIKEFRHDLREEWLKILIQDDVTETGGVRYKIR